MGIKLSELSEGSPITLMIHNGQKSLKMGAFIKKHIKPNVATINLDYDTKRTIVFENVRIKMQYSKKGEVPIVWENVRIVNIKSEYVLQVASDGMRSNRRNSSRVSVYKQASLRSANGPSQVMIRDISLSGFSISDTKNAVSFKMGEEISIKLDDMGHILNLVGKVVRIEKQEDVTIFGLEICNLCKDLSSYVSMKQRKSRTAKK